MKFTDEQRQALSEKLVESWKAVWRTPYDVGKVGILPQYADAMVDKIEEILDDEQAK